MNFESCYRLGHIVRTHGLKGEVQIYLDVDYPEDYYEMESVFVELNQQLVPFFIEEIKIQPQKKAILKFEDINSSKDAEALVGKSIYQPLNMLPELKEGQFYYHDLLNYKIIDKELGELGIITNFLEMPGQDLIMMEYLGKEVLIPLNDDLIQKVEHDKKILHMELPHGLVDLYMDDEIDQQDEDL